MSDFPRRDFLAGAALFSAATTAALTPKSEAEGATHSTNQQSTNRLQSL
jgi:hypothetical protein